MPSSRGSSQPRIKPRFPALQVDSLPSEPPGNSKNTGVGSLPLLQGNFLTQEFALQWILYQLSYQGSPLFLLWQPLKILSFSLILSSLNVIGLLVCFFCLGFNPALFALSFFDLFFDVSLI